MNKFIQEINVAYPPGNKPIFEEWFAKNYSGCDTDRELMPFFPTSYFVNNGYNENEQANKAAQDYIDGLNRSKKWFVICQYDNGVFVDWKGLDVLEFNMSKKIGVELPLICQPHPYKFDTPKKYFISFVGSMTHPIRERLKVFENREDCYISFQPHSIEDYCRILHESIFSLCPRGFGANSFRIQESVQYHAMPIYLSDEFIVRKDCLFNEFGLLVHESEKLVDAIANIGGQVIGKQLNVRSAFDKYFSYESVYKYIISELGIEYRKRSVGENIQSLG